MLASSACRRTWYVREAAAAAEALQATRPTPPAITAAAATIAAILTAGVLATRVITYPCLRRHRRFGCRRPPLAPPLQRRDVPGRGRLALAFAQRPGEQVGVRPGHDLRGRGP